MIRRNSMGVVRFAIDAIAKLTHPFHLVVRYPFEDHNAPPFELIGECCNDMDAYLKEDPTYAPRRCCRY